MAAVFRGADGELFFVEYQTDLDLERLTREHGVGGSVLVGATSVGEARILVRGVVRFVSDDVGRFNLPW